MKHRACSLFVGGRDQLKNRHLRFELFFRVAEHVKGRRIREGHTTSCVCFIHDYRERIGNLTEATVSDPRLSFFSILSCCHINGSEELKLI